MGDKPRRVKPFKPEKFIAVIDWDGMTTWQIVRVIKDAAYELERRWASGDRSAGDLTRVIGVGDIESGELG